MSVHKRDVSIMTGLLLVLPLLPSCAAVTMLDTSRPIEVEGNPMFFATLHQDGKLLLVPDVEDKLSRIPEANAKMGGYQALKWGSMLLSGIGGGLIGWDVGYNLRRTTDRTLSLVGLGLAVSAIPLSAIAGAQLGSAVEAYNSTLQPKKSGASLVPLISVGQPSADGQPFTAGFAARF